MMSEDEFTNYAYAELEKLVRFQLPYSQTLPPSRSRGLASFTKEVGVRMPHTLHEKLIDIATQRNNLTHRHTPLPDRHRFETLFHEARDQLHHLGPLLTRANRFEIVNKGSGKALDIAGWNEEDGASLHQWSPSKDLNQTWFLSQLRDYEFAIISRFSGKCLDVAGSLKDDFAPVHMWEWCASDNQRWWIEEMEDGSYKITAKHSSKCLDVSGASRDDGATIVQYPWHGGDNQRWWIKLHP